MPATSLGDSLFSQTLQRVLALLFGKPDQRFYTNEILRSVAMGRGSVTRELDRLCAAGILVRSREANLVFYQANSACPIYPELLSLVRKSFGVAQVLQDALQPAWDRIELAFVYGSVAKASDHAASDLDFMVVGNKLALADIVDLLQPAETILQRVINPTIYERQDLTVRLREQNSFITRVMEQPKLWVKGSDHDIESLADAGRDRPTEGGKT